MALKIFVSLTASFLFLFCEVKNVIGREDLRFSLDGTVYVNNSVVTITDIGAEDSTTPLQCITDLRPCCRQDPGPQNLMGQWHYPNGSMIQDRERNYDFFRTRGLNDGTVNLFRRNSGVDSPFGSYCCEIPDTSGVDRTLCANLAPSGFSLVINDGGAVPTTGQNYSLTCSVSGGSVSSYQWWKDGAVLQNQTTQILSFSPLRLSNASRYTCQVNVTASSETFTVYQNHSVIIQIPAPTSVSVTSDQPNPIRPIGSTVTLTCTVVLAEYVEGLTVNTELTGPNEFSQNGTAQRMESTTTYTSTAMVSSFGRNQSGDYTCTATVSSTSSFLTNSTGSSSTRVTVGVYLSQNGMLQANNSALFISDITILQCITDAVSCCATDPAGEWFFPDGGMVPIQSSATTFYRNRGDNGTVNLNRLNDVMMPTGRFCCVVPDATGVSQWACAIIFVVQISNGGATPVAGQSYTLTCDTSGATGLTYQWSRNNGDISQESTTQTLSFSTLSLSDGGDYTCTASLSSRTFTNTFSLIVQVPEPSSVTVTSNPSTIQTFGTSVEVICTVELSQGLVDSNLSLLMVDTQLSREGTPLTLTGPTVTGTTYTYTIQLDSFEMSHVGGYVCTATVSSLSTSAYITGNGTTTGRATIDIAQSGGSNGGAIAGGVIVLILALVAATVTVVVVVLFVMRRRRILKGYKATSLPTPISYSKRETVTGMKKFDEIRILKFPPDTNITEGEGVYFKVKVSGVPQPTVTWYHDGEPVKADYAREVEEDGSLAIPSTELKHSGVYKAVVANQHGSEEREVKLTVSEEGGASTADVAANGMVSSRPIPISEFGQYVSELHANSNQPFKDLYQSLDSGEEGRSTSYAISGGRKPLNRFGNIVVYDDNRIVLEPLPDVPNSEQDYINACYIDGYSVPNKFIATQGPLPKTLVDFWRLVWQERPPTIVMVTNVKEGNRIKCQQYWPDSGKKEIGPFQVTIADQQIFADYTVRTLSVSLGSGRSHKVTQYHFTAWPDHGVPDYATPILAFHRRVKAQHHPSRGPMLVHCSAGVGRTGTFIVTDNILEQIEKEQVVDIPGAITKIRQKRMKMVQTHDQFTFIHDAILESVTCGDTQISATNLRMNIAKMKKRNPQNQMNGFQQQFKILEQVSPNPEELQCGTALGYPDRNRNERFLPADRWRVIIKGEQPDYIHAISTNGYKHKRAFIIAQSPMQNTVRNFWKMIYDRRCAVVVMVSGLMEEGQEASAQYWPDNGIIQLGEFTVDLLGEESLEGFTIRNLSVMDNKTQRAHQVTQFHITCWTADGCCSNLRSITDVIEEMTKVQIRSGNKPIVVHCNDTVTRSGMFCAIATTIERCKTEGVVDVFQVVKALRVQKPGAVPTVDNFKQIFDTILVYLESFDTYANFQNI